jgi:hypothetical protein
MLVRNVFIKHHPTHAGKWIYRGYKKAWEKLGYSVHYYDNLSEISNFKDNYYLMAIDGNINNTLALDIVKRSQKTFLYIQPNVFPEPWGRHPNFICHCPDAFIDELNKMDNVTLWSFGNSFEYHTKWKEGFSIPLAFDSESYQYIEDKNYEFDVCFVGGWANNGLNEKREIMLQYFGKFKDSGLKCGIFINKNLTHKQESAILFNSKVAINIHDAYQRILGLDTNERTFKSIGTTGILVSDNIKHIADLGLNVRTTDTADEMIEAVKHCVYDLSDEQRKEIKFKNQQDTLQNHTYIKRVEELLRVS